MPAAVIYFNSVAGAAKTSMKLIFMPPQRDLALKNVLRLRIKNLKLLTIN
jgi:hypothetical protein